MFAIGSTLISGSRFSIKETMTSVELFLSKIDTMGIKWIAASSGDMRSASLQIEKAMLPFTCWLLSVVSCNFNLGSSVYTIKEVVQFAARSDSLFTDSDLTSGSLSPKRVT